jgi:tetratricopeptide (TPR) repeat protein
MELRVPKRYRRSQRRVLGSWRNLRNCFFVSLLVVAAYWFYLNQTLASQELRAFRESFYTQLPTLQASLPQAPTPTMDVTGATIDADTAYRTGDFERAIESYRQVIQGSPNLLEAHYRLGLLLLITSDLGENRAKIEEAVQVGDLAINADPEAPDGWAIKAMALVWAGDYGQALAYAQRALELDANFVQAQAFLAEAYWRLDERDLALTTIQAAVDYLRSIGSASSETVAIVFRTQGYIAERNLDRELAIQAYELARQAAPTHSYLSLELALSYFGNNQTDEAIVLLNQALDASPRDPALMFQLGRVYLNVGRNDESLQTLQRCVDTNPAYAPCLSWLGGLQYSQGRYALAIPNLEAAIANGSTDWSDRLQLGLSYNYTGNCNRGLPFLWEGYQLTAANVERQERYASALRECGVEPTQPTPGPLPSLDPNSGFITPSPEFSPTP